MGVFEGSLTDYNNSGQTINGFNPRYKFSLYKILLPSSPPYPHDFDVTTLQLLPQGLQIKERRKLSFTIVTPYTDNVDNATHVVAHPHGSVKDSVFYKVDDFKILNSTVCEISVVFDAITTLLVNKPRLSGLVTATVNGDTPITDSYTPTHLLKERSCTFKGTGKMCLYVTLKSSLGDDWLAQTSSDTGIGIKRGYANTTTETIYRTLLPDRGLGTIAKLIYQLVVSEVTRGGMFVQDIWFEEQPPEGVDTVEGSLELGASNIGEIVSPIILERVVRRFKVVAQSNHPLPYSKYDTINQPLTSMGIHISYGDSTTTIPYRNIVDYTSKEYAISNSLDNVTFEVLYTPTSTSASNSKICVYNTDSRKPLAEYDIPTTSIGSVSHPFATDFFTYQARNAVAVTEEIIQTMLAITFNIGSLLDSMKKDYVGVADSILSFFFTNAARLASIIDMKRLPIEGGGGSMTPINTLYIEYDVTPAKTTYREYSSSYVYEVGRLSLYERYNRKFSCAVKVEDVDWTESVFTDDGYSVLSYPDRISYIQGNFIISDVSVKYTSSELHEMMNILSEGILLVKGIEL